MANLPPDPDAIRDDTSHVPGYEAAPSTPRWVKVFGIIFIILIVLFVILHLTGNRFRNHTGSGHAGGHTPSVEQRMQQP
jgi:hypothetical protein